MVWFIDGRGPVGGIGGLCRPARFGEFGGGGGVFFCKGGMALVWVGGAGGKERDG